MPSTVTKTEHHLHHPDGCKLVIDGALTIKEGIKKYHDEGLTIRDLEADLKACDFHELSIHQLRRIQTQMRKDKELPPHPNSRDQSARKSARESVENVQDVIDVEPTPIPTEEKKDMGFEQFKNLDDLFAQTQEQTNGFHQPGRLVQHQPDFQCGVLAPGELTIPEHVQDRDAFSAGQQIIESLSFIYEECERWQKQGRIPAQQWSTISSYCDYIHASASCGGAQSTKSELNTVDVAWSADDGDEVRAQSNG